MDIKRDKRSVEQGLWLKIFYLMFLASLGQYGVGNMLVSKVFSQNFAQGTHLKKNK